MTATMDRLTAAQRREHDKRSRLVDEARVKGWNVTRRIQWLNWRLSDAIEAVNGWVDRVRRHEHDLVLLRDGVEDAKHYHDHRLDEIWTVLVQAGLLPSHELHHTVRDNSDVWGRVEGCDHCAPDLARHPFEGSVTDRIEADRLRIRAQVPDYWDDDETDEDEE